MEKVYKHIVVLTGAGISAESGLATFRSSNGLWNNHKVEDVATIEAFEKNPEYVHQFYNQMKPELLSAHPNLAHFALAKLQNEYLGKVDIITQNIDTLHEKAGTKRIYHIHGQINQAVCLNCGHVEETWADIDTQTQCPHCSTTGMFKPNIVFFGESLLCMDKVDKLLRQCDLFISVGTSGVVYPAAGFAQTARYFGAQTLEFNLENTSNNFLFNRHVYGKCSETLPAFVHELLTETARHGEE